MCMRCARLISQVGASVAATSECKGINGLLEVIESEFSAKSGAAVVTLIVDSATTDQAGWVHLCDMSLDHLS